MFAFIKRWRRRRLARHPFPAEWLPYLEALPFYVLYPVETQTRFRALLSVFVREKNWEGAGGFELSDEHKVTVAATAVRLVLGLDLSYYDCISSIIIYPNDYKHPDNDHGVILGQVSRLGALVLSWNAVERGLKSQSDGRDTTVHEFAHALDLADGSFDGLPPQRERQHVHPWCQVMGEQYQAMQNRRRSRRHLLRDYGATNPAELFAVASEVFFERPTAMKERKPEVYEVMRTFYGFDPVVGEARRRKPTRRERNARKRRRRERGL